MWWLWFACSGKIQDTEIQAYSCDARTDSFAVLDQATLTQIHADVASDGRQVWITYNLPNEDGDFDVYLTAIACDGTTTWGPLHILAFDGHNQTTPRVAVSGDRVLVAAQADSGTGPTNLSISLHVRTTEGVFIGEHLWETDLSSGNAWLPSVVGDEDGFWIAAALANETHFRTAVQALDFDGQPRAAAHWVGSDAYAVFPNIDVQNGRYLVGWENGDDAVQYMQGDSNGTQGDVSTIENNGYARVLWEPDGEAHVYSHQRSPLELQRDGRSISGLGNTLFANAARGDGTVLFAYYRLQSGYKNDVYYGSIDVDGEQTADILLASDPPAAPYRPAVTHVFDNTYFVAWSQGENPDFALWGQFVTVE